MLKTIRAAVGATAVAGVLGVAGVVGVGAPTGSTGTMSATPETVAQGETVTISSVTPCTDHSMVVGGADGIAGSDFNENVDDGHWSAEIEIPGDQEPGIYVVEAQCVNLAVAALGLGAPVQQASWPYAPVDITVVAQETTTTTSTTTTAPTTTTTEPPAAAPTVAAPTYTG